MTKHAIIMYDEFGPENRAVSDGMVKAANTADPRFHINPFAIVPSGKLWY